MICPMPLKLVIGNHKVVVTYILIASAKYRSIGTMLNKDYTFKFLMIGAFMYQYA